MIEERKPAPKLYFRKTSPFEHEVIPYNQLHPKLQEQVDEIKGGVTAAHISSFIQAIALADAYAHKDPSFMAAPIIISAMTTLYEARNLAKRIGLVL